MKKTWVIVLCSVALGAGAVLGGTAIYNAGVNAEAEKTKKAESEKAASEKKESQAKEDSMKKESEKAKKESEAKAASEQEAAQAAAESKSEIVAKPAPTQAQLLQRWEQIIDMTPNKSFKLVDQPGEPGTMNVVDGTAPIGQIVDNGNGTYDFKKIGVERVNGIAQMKQQTVATETV